MHRLSSTNQGLKAISAGPPDEWEDLVKEAVKRRVLVVGRNPYARVVSGFYNKFCNDYWTSNQALYSYLESRQVVSREEHRLTRAYVSENRNIISYLRDTLGKSYRFPSFSDFMLITKDLYGDESLNEHYTPICYELQRHHLQTEALEAIRVEELDRFLESQGLNIEVKVNATNYEIFTLSETTLESYRATPGERIAELKTKVPYHQLLIDEDLRQINSMFRDDFALFGYERTRDSASLRKLPPQ